MVNANAEAGGVVDAVEEVGDTALVANSTVAVVSSGSSMIFRVILLEYCWLTRSCFSSVV